MKPPRLFTHELQAAGYPVSWPTKTDFNFNPPTDFASNTDEWWNTGLPRTPFFAYRNFGITHESSMWDATPHGGGYLTSIQRLAPERRTNPATVCVPAYLPDTPEVRREIARYFDMLAIQDDEVGMTLAAIERAGVADNTVVIYLTDHGRGLAREKRWCYDAGLHLPLVVRWPGRIAPGTVDSQLVSWTDVAPTILTIAGANVPAHYQGQSIFSSDRKYAFSGRDRMDEQFDRVRTITDGRFRYIRNDFPHLPYAQRNAYQENQLTTQTLRLLDAGDRLAYPNNVFMQPSKPPEELYDASSDPEMVHHLAGDAQFAGKLSELRAALARELDRFGDLGMEDETEQIARGLVVDRLTSEYRPRIAPLSAVYAARSGPTYLTMNEAEAARDPSRLA